MKRITYKTEHSIERVESIDVYLSNHFNIAIVCCPYSGHITSTNYVNNVLFG